MKLVLTLLLLGACGGGKDNKDGGGGGKPEAFASADAVLDAARERTKAMCACADKQCRGDVGLRPNDPFGEKARAARDQFTDAQKKAWKEILTEWAACSVRK
jgi:hypothetical protein